MTAVSGWTPRFERAAVSALHRLSPQQRRQHPSHDQTLVRVSRREVTNLTDKIESLQGVAAGTGTGPPGTCFGRFEGSQKRKVEGGRSTVRADAKEVPVW
jgi:hypothetical protein